MNCWKWIQVQGSNPNTGEEMSEFKCSDSWMPILTIENSQQQRQTGAAVESLRNVVAATEIHRIDGKVTDIEVKSIEK